MFKKKPDVIYDGKCPGCGSSKHKFIELLNPYLQRYQCRKCKMFFRYDISGR